MSSEIDWWDTEATRHFGGYMLANSKRLVDLYPGRIREAAQIMRRAATSWAKECRQIPDGGPPDGGKVLWQMRVRRAEQEMANALPNIPVMPTEQIGLLGKGTEVSSQTPGGSRHADDQ